ncbi:LysR family transcriptional regulator [Allorhizobium undicola]|uniref:LysR family transcriptional regulator n=1 Tax=Allorhizobium undicola TaxID=78527 RepID=UPI00048624E4|nr:LysR family transcriptional regulator [Allorhizobium undicola]
MTMRRSLVPDIVNLQAFECAARHQNFSRAAEELNLTQSAVSRQIADLERQIGMKLFQRIRQRVVLSEAGQRLLPEVKELLIRSERLMIGAVARGHRSAALKIAALPTFGSKWLVPRLGDFLARFPDVAITMESRSSPFDLNEENFDLAFHFGQPVWAGGFVTFLCGEQVLPVASPSLAARLRGQVPVLPEQASLLHLTTRPKLWADWCEIHGVEVQNAYSGLRFDQFSMVSAAAQAGLGVALLPTYLIEEEMEAGLLVPIAALPMSTENAYYVVRPESRRTQAMADAFENWVLGQVGSRRP